jgi:CO/xanthine dehydrogenase Mo-binding subunit
LWRFIAGLAAAAVTAVTTAGGDGTPTVMPLVAGAVGNAIATLTGVCLRERPFSPDRVRAALGA